jgi:hypothetical protein
MPNVDTWLIAAKDMPRRDPGPTFVRVQFATGTAVANADVVRICKIPRYAVVKGAVLAHGGTLGASATAQLRRETTALTAATTAGGADFENQSVVDEPNTDDGDDYLNVLAGGANWGTSATMTVECWLVEAVNG